MCKSTEAPGYSRQDRFQKGASKSLLSPRFDWRLRAISGKMYVVRGEWFSLFQTDIGCVNCSRMEGECVSGQGRGRQYEQAQEVRLR